MRAVAAEDEQAAEIAEMRSEAAPELDPGLRWVWRAWERLSPSRPHASVGMSVPMGGTVIVPRPMPIPWADVQRWAEVHRLDEQAANALDRYIRALDGAFLAWWRKDHAESMANLSAQQPR